MIVAHASPPEDGASLSAWSRQERVKVAETLDDMLDAACTREPRLVLSNIDRWPPGLAADVVRRLQAAESSIPVVLRTNLSDRALAELPRLCAHDIAGRIRLSYRDYEPMDAWLTGEGWQRQRCAAIEILCNVALLVPPEVQPTFVRLAVMCARQIASKEIGLPHGLGKNTLRRHLRICGIRNFRHGNAVFLATHALVTLEDGGSESLCADRAGFLNAPELNRYLKYHFQQTLSQLRFSGGSAAMIARIAQSLHAD